MAKHAFDLEEHNVENERKIEEIDDINRNLMTNEAVEWNVPNRIEENKKVVKNLEADNKQS